MPLYTYILALFLWLWLGQSGLQAQDTRRIGVNDQQNFPHYAPVLSPDGSLLLYSEVGNHANFGRSDLADIWICQNLSENQWSRPVNIGIPINSDQNDQCLAINLDENELYLLLEDEAGKKSIAQSKLSFRSWSTPQTMQIEPWDSTFQIQHGFVSNDGQTLLLCLTNPDSTRRRSDIYVAQREGELLWKNLQSLGPIINTPGNERSAFLAADGQTLYFSSSGHKGFGGLDLYMSRRTANSWTDWSAPINLGSTFNSEHDEWGFYTSVIGETAWWTRTEARIPRILSGNIPGSLRAQDVILIKGQVYLPQSKNPASNVTVSLNYFDPQRNTRVLRQGISNLQGKYQLLLPRNAEMTVNALSGQFFSPTYNLLRKGPAAIEREDSDEMMNAMLAANPTYRQIEEEIEALQLAYNQNLVAIKNLNKERQRYVTSILQQWKDTASISFKTLESGLNKLREDYAAAQKQQALLKFHDGSPKLNDPSSTIETFIPTVFEDFVRLIEIQQRWEILPATAQSLILQMLTEEVKRKDKQVKADERAIWREQKEQILKNPTLLLLPEADLAKWQGVFSPCFEWQEEVSREISNYILQKNQNELTTQIKTDVRNYLRTLLDMRMLAAQSAAMNQQIRIKIEGQLRIERGFQYRPSTRPASESTTMLDTLMVIAANELEQDIQLFDPIVEKTIVLENIVFLPNQSELDSSAYAEIHRMSAFLKENPDLAIEIVAHTNNHCTYNFATELTNRRAERIADLLVLDQVPMERIRARGSGKEQPIATNSSPAGRLANQRIEIVFIDQ
ncbi:OmpA family protein [Haliscomenobacter sp.]|uniref:OmpA family protein n=1 Tax=Haliscomenobacter sp. TaxID=2717303 RepID=UPI003594859B